MGHVADVDRHVVVGRDRDRLEHDPLIGDPLIGEPLLEDASVLRLGAAGGPVSSPAREEEQTAWVT